MVFRPVPRGFLEIQLQLLGDESDPPPPPKKTKQNNNTELLIERLGTPSTIISTGITGLSVVCKTVRCRKEGKKATHPP